MINSNIPNLDSMSTVKAKVDFYNGSTLAQTCYCIDHLEDFELAREGDNSKFFGFGICHRLDFNLVDLYRNLDVAKEYTVELGLGDGTTWDAPYPTFYITELKRDEKTNTITATSYDKLYWAGEYLFKDLGLEAPYTIRDVAQAIAGKLGLTLNIPSAIAGDFLLNYSEGANLETTEDLRSILNWIAEATQTIYFVNYQNRLTFKRLDRDGDSVLDITRDLYYELDTKTPRTLVTICNTTELGDNVETGLEDETGAIQYIRNNPFLELRTDLADILENAKVTVGGTTITQINCDWSGDYRLEIGDKIALATEDGNWVYSYVLSDTVTFAGTLNEKTEWDYTDQQPETYANPTNIGERINQTFARVDKVNKEIALVASEVSENREEIGSLKVTTDSISSEVGRIEDLTEVNSTAISSVKQTADELTAGLEKVDQKADLNKENTDAELLTLRSKIDVKLDTSSFEIELNEALTQGVDQLTVKNRNFNFGYDGLTISDDHADISTNVDIDGLSVMQRSNEVLKAGAIYDTNGNRTIGVTTANLHAKTYLWVGNNSRFEDYVNGTRTGCFWVG